MDKLLAIPKLGAFIISLTIVMLFGALQLYAMKFGLLDNAPLNQITGAMIAAFASVYNYWLGSSSSSKDKDAVIAKQVDTANAASKVEVIKP